MRLHSLQRRAQQRRRTMRNAGIPCRPCVTRRSYSSVNVNREMTWTWRSFFSCLLASLNWQNKMFYKITKIKLRRKTRSREREIRVREIISHASQARIMLMRAGRRTARKHMRKKHHATRCSGQMARKRDCTPPSSPLPT